MRKLRLLLTAVVAAVGLAVPGTLPASMAAADEADRISSLGVPLRDVLLIGGTVAPGPDGRTALWSVSSGSPAHLNAVDPVTGEAIARLDLPGAGGAWGVDRTPEGDIYIAPYGNGHMFRWSREEGVVDLGRPSPTDTFLLDIAVDDTTGKVYVGTTPGGRLYGYDPATNQYRDYGRLSPAHAYANRIAAYGGKVYVGTNPPATVFEVDAETGASRTMPLPADLNPADAWVYDVDIFGGYMYVRFGTAFPSPLYVYDMAAGAWIDRLDNAHGLEPSPPDEQGRVYLIQAGELIRYDPRDGSELRTGMPFLGRVANTRGIGWAELGLPDYPGRSIVGLLWRGMMFRYNPTTGARSFVQTTVQGEPIDITALTEGPDGRVYAGGYLNGGFAAVDPGTGRVAEFHTFSQSEDMATHGDKLYVGAYPDARLYEYDPDLPWHSPEYSPSPEPGPVDNPARLFDLKRDYQIRPRAITSAGDHVAVGTMPDLGHLGGVLAIWDPASRTLRSSARNVVTDQSIVALAYRDGVVYGGTSIYSGQSATPPTQTEAKLFAWSIAENRKLWEIVPAPGKPAIPALTFDGAGRLWGTAGGEVFAVDVGSRQVTVRHSYSESRSALGQIAYNPVDGMLYGLLAGSQFYWLDPDTGRREVVRQGPGAQLAVHSSGDVYFSAGSELFRYDLPDTPCPHPDPAATVTIREVDSGVPNRAADDGCTVDDLIADEADWPTKGQLVRHVSHVTRELVDRGLISRAERARIVVAAAHTREDR